jgi:autotransporter translocation and assembly factor TamB
VDVTGTLKDSRIVLGSDPPRPEPEVFALLIGGPAPDQASDGSTGNTGSAAGAVGLGSGVAALGVSELLLGESPVTLSVGTTSESRPRYTAAVRIGQDLWFEASTYERATSGANNDARSVFSGTIDYRFTRNWSLRTEVGTAGGVMDLLWQYRY